jgi:hypothetical protein
LLVDFINDLFLFLVGEQGLPALVTSVGEPEEYSRYGLGVLALWLYELRDILAEPVRRDDGFLLFGCLLDGLKHSSDLGVNSLELVLDKVPLIILLLDFLLDALHGLF